MGEHGDTAREATNAGAPLVLFGIEPDMIEIRVRVLAKWDDLRDDVDEVTTARSRLGTDRLLGVSVATVADVAGAEAAGADYLGVSVWSIGTELGAIAAGLAGLRAVIAATGCRWSGSAGSSPATPNRCWAPAQRAWG